MLRLCLSNLPFSLPEVGLSFFSSPKVGEVGRGMTSAASLLYLEVDSLEDSYPLQLPLLRGRVKRGSLLRGGRKGGATQGRDKKWVPYSGGEKQGRFLPQGRDKKEGYFRGRVLEKRKEFNY